MMKCKYRANWCCRIEIGKWWFLVTGSSRHVCPVVLAWDWQRSANFYQVLPFNFTHVPIYTLKHLPMFTFTLLNIYTCPRFHIFTLIFAVTRLITSFTIYLNSLQALCKVTMYKLSYKLYTIALHGTNKLYCMALHNIALHCTRLHNNARHCIALHDIAQHCTTLHNIAQHCMALHNIVKHCIALNPCTKC